MILCVVVLWIFAIVHWSKLTECTIQSEPKVDCGLQLKTVYQYWFISCNKCSTSVQDVDNRTCGHRGGGEGGLTPGAGDGQGGLVCRGPWGHKELDTFEQLN